MAFNGPFSPMMLCAFLGGPPLKRALPLALTTCENADQLVVFLWHSCASCFAMFKLAITFLQRNFRGWHAFSMDDVKVNNRLGHVHAGNHLPTSPLDGVNSQKCETSLQTDPSFTRLLTGPRSDTL